MDTLAGKQTRDAMTAPATCTEKKGHRVAEGRPIPAMPPELPVWSSAEHRVRLSTGTSYSREDRLAGKAYHCSCGSVTQLNDAWHSLKRGVPGRDDTQVDQAPIAPFPLCLPSLVTGRRGRGRR